MKAKNTSTLIGRFLQIGFVALVALIALLNSIYTINTGQEVVIQRFGAYIKTVTTPGINFKIPFVDDKTVVDVNKVHRMEFGFQTLEYADSTPTYNDSVSSRMLTGDENIAVVETIVQYQIKNSYDYLFNVDDIDGTLMVVGESVIRRVIGNHTLDEALTENKNGIQTEILADLQNICDKYNSGIKIISVQLQDVNPPSEVDEAFRDVAGAREDKTSYINEANAYRNEVLPSARGEAATLVNGAEAYSNNRVESAKAAVTAYQQLYEVYKEGQEITKTRMYLEAMAEVLQGVDIYIMDDENGMKLFDIN